MGSVIPLKKSANSAYLDLKNLLNELISHISGKLLSPGVVSDKISFIMDTSVSLGFRFIEDSFLLNYFSHPPLPPLIPKDENLNKIVDNLIDKEFSEKFSSVSKEFFDQLIYFRYLNGMPIATLKRSNRSMSKKCHSIQL